MSNNILNDFQKALDFVQAAENNKNPKYRYFCYNEKQKQNIEQFDETADVVIIPQSFRADNEQDEVYIFPMPEIEPIKIVYEGNTIEDAFVNYFEKITGYKPDKFENDEEGLKLKASYKLNQKEKEELIKNIQYGV